LKTFNFPTARVFAFNDAVFSIAITLLVLDIAAPSQALIDQHGFWEALRFLTPNFIGFFISFWVIALYWKFYLLFSRYIDSFDNKLIWQNIFLLLFVVLLPFSTALFVDNVMDDGPYTFYCGNLILLSLFQLVMLQSVLKRAKLKVDKITRSWLRFRAVNTLFVWILAFALSFYFPIISRIAIALIFIVQFFGKLYFKRKALTNNTLS